MISLQTFDNLFMNSTRSLAVAADRDDFAAALRNNLWSGDKDPASRTGFTRFPRSEQAVWNDLEVSASVAYRTMVKCSSSGPSAKAGK